MTVWALDNRTPYAAERSWVRDKHGVHHWVVAVKATFDIAENGALRLADEQPLPAVSPEYTGEPGRSSLRHDSDLLYIKRCTDVIAEAYAHPPHGRPADKTTVRMRVGPLQKDLFVFGPRFYRRGLLGVVLSSPEPFVAQPITYEAAYGGSDLTDPNPKLQGLDERNPVGKGFAVDSSRLLDTLAPSIEYPGANIAKAGPAGFGAIDASWLPRRKYAGTYDARWVKERKPLPPDDYDDLYASSAPADQRPRQQLNGGERVELFGMRPDGALCFDLPKLYLTYTTFIGRRQEPHRGKLITVLLQPEQRQVSLVWQSTLKVGAGEIDYVDQTRIIEKPYVR